MSAAATPGASILSMFPRSFSVFLARVLAALPGARYGSAASHSPATRADMVVTIVVLIALLYMTIGALLRHVKEGVDLEAARRRIPFLQLLQRYYGALTLLIAAGTFLSDASRHIIVTVSGELRQGPAPRLETFWAFNFIALLMDIFLSSIATVRPVTRLVAVLFPSLRPTLVHGSIGRAAQAVGQLEATELMATRVGMLGACYVLAYFGK
jgi:hypothetical protein